MVPVNTYQFPTTIKLGKKKGCKLSEDENSLFLLNSFVGYMICKYVLSLADLNSNFWRAMSPSFGSGG